MADAMDIEQERQQLILDAQIEQARHLAVPGTARCASCQELHETKLRHYRG